MLTLFMRAILLYLLLVLTMRGMGKRLLGQFQPYEFAITMLLANLIATPMSDVSTPLMYGLLPVAALFLVHSVITLLSVRSDRLRAVVSGKPCVVVSNGIIQRDELKRLSLSLSDLLEGLRGSGIMDIDEVGTAIIEANGMISAFPMSARRPVTLQDMNFETKYEGLPLILIMDGRIQLNSLNMAGKDQAWLDRMLSGLHLGIEQVFICSLNTQGEMHIQDMKGAVSKVQALQPGEVKW